MNREQECIEVIEALVSIIKSHGALSNEPWLSKSEALILDLQQDIAERTPVEQGGAR